MLKVAVFCCLAALAFGQQQPICLPPTFQWQRSQNFNGNYNGFDLSSEFYSTPTRQYRTVRQTFVNGTQYFFEVIVFAGQGKMWQIEGKTGGGAISCTYHTGMFPMPAPCLLPNATYQDTVFVAASTPVQIYFESQWFRNITVYQEIGLVQNLGIPVWSREAFSNNEFSLEMYYNFASELPSDAFVVPNFCPTSEPSTTSTPLEYFQSLWPQMLRSQPPQYFK